MANPVELVGGIAIGTGVGAAVGATVTPKLQEYLNEQWAKYPHKRPSAGVLAAGVAQGQIDRTLAEVWAGETGVGVDEFNALVDIASTGPGVPAAFELWRRGKINEAGFRRATKRQGIEQEWIDDLVRLFHSVLDTADLARGIHRGLVPDPGLLKGELPSGEGNVPAYPVYNIDALAEALAAGFDKDHLGVLVGLQGNPMGAHEAAEAFFRGILTRDDYLRAIAEGNTRNEWADAILAQTRQIPTAREFLENALRGYRSLAEALAGAARHGMSHDDALMVYQNQGRPMNVRQITQALARGGKFKPEPGEITDPYDAAIVEGNLKPAYYDLAKANRYTLPSPFVMKSLTVAKTWTQQKAETRLLQAGWIPEDAKEAAADWASGTTTTADPHITKAQVQLWSTTHRSYIAEETDDAGATTALEAAGVEAASVPAILALWQQERALRRKQLTPAQVKKAYVQGITNQDTGARFTRDDALAALLERGYSPASAYEFLDL